MVSPTKKWVTECGTCVLAEADLLAGKAVPQPGDQSLPRWAFAAPDP
jgi:hypothetical protein